MSADAPGKILLRSPNWLGDAVMALPAVRALRLALPGARLVVAAPSKLAPLWQACPSVDAVVPLEEPRKFRSSVPALRRASGEHGPFDAALLFPNSLRSALEARLAGIGNLVALADSRAPVRNWLLSRPVPRRPFDPARLHQRHDYLHLAAAISALSAEAGKDDASGPLLRLPPLSDEETPGAILCPGAAYGPAKRWPAERFAAVGRALLERGLGPVWVMGAAGDAAAAAEVAAAVPGAVNRAGETPLGSFMAAIGRARIVVTNDSGAMHLAAALGTPGVAVFGSTEPRLTGPVSPCVRPVRYHVPCSPCFLRECPLEEGRGRMDCMDRVDVEAVLAACGEALAA